MSDEDLSYRPALRAVAFDVLGALGLVAVGVLALVVGELGVDAWAVPILAAVVAGEQFWHRRLRVPTEVPKLEIEAAELAQAPRDHWFMLGFWLVVTLVLVAAAVLIGGGGNVLLGFTLGFFLRDVARTGQIVIWERRHGRRLLWHQDAERTRYAVLARA